MANGGLGSLRLCGQAGLVCGIALAACVVAMPAAADPGYTVQLSVEGTHDGNLYRLPDNAPLPAGRCRSDTSGRAQAQVSAKLESGGWQGDVRAAGFHEAYDCNSGLDNTGFDGAFTVNSPDTGLVALNFTGSASRRLSSFSDLRSFVNNSQTLVQLGARARIGVTPDLKIVIDPSFLVSTNSDTVLKQLDYRRYGGSVGIGYFSPLGNSAVLKLTQNYSDGLNARPTVFNGAPADLRTRLRDTSVDLELTYQPSPLTRISGTISYVDRDDRRPADADYNGITGNIVLAYTPDDTLTASLNAGRQLASQTNLFIDAARSDYIRFTISKAVSATLRFDGRAELIRQHYTLDPLLGLGAGGDDDRLHFEGGAALRIDDRIDARAYIAHDKRMSGSLYQPYAALSGGLRLAYAFGTAR